MPLKTSSHRHKKPPSLWRDELGCSEDRVCQIARELALELNAGDRVFLEGPMGVGKTTFAKALLEGLGVEQPPEGSPTFAIAHEYRARIGEIMHLDLFRLKNDDELDEAGVPSYFWERDGIVLVEWISLFPAFLNLVRREQNSKKTIWEVSLEFHHEQRRIQVVKRPL